MSTTGSSSSPRRSEKVCNKYVAGLVFAQPVFFIAMLGPAIIGIGLKVQAVVPLAEQTSAIGVIAGFGALCSR